MVKTEKNVEGDLVNGIGNEFDMFGSLASSCYEPLWEVF